MLREAFRVLKPGGRFAVSDVVTRGDMPPEIRENMLLWVGCIAGALEEYEYRAKLAAAGFDAHRHRADAHLQQSKTRANFSAARASMWTPSRRKSTANS